MAYRILYGDAILWDPYSDAGNALSDVSMTMTVNAAKYLDFTMPPTHDLYDEVAEKHKTVRVYSDKKIIYKGYITEISLDIYGYKSISCTSVLAYLNDTHVRDYSTIEGEQPLKAPAEIDGLFKWYIEQHNSHVRGVDKQFRVGINQAQQLNSTNHVYRSSTQFPTTAEEIENKILDMGGYMFERYDGDANVIDFYSDAHEANTQILDFGINITDFTKETTTDDQYTAIYASGYTPDPPEDDQEKEMKPINLGDISDSDFKYAGGDLVKVGDIIYSHSAVSRYGYKEYYYSNDDITTLDYLQEAASKVLNTLIAPVVTLNVNAVDLALFMDNGYEHLQLGQAVRVRSKPHNVDEYLMISAIDLDLQDPGNTSYTIGATYDTLTGQQSSFIKGLNSNINTALDSVTKLDEETKKNALDAAEAERRAKAAEEAAKNAQDTADKAQEAADAAADDAKKGIDDAKAAADAAADVRDKNDALTERVSLAEKQVTQITGDTATAIQNAKNAQDAADAAKTAADNAQASANEAYSMIGNANSQIEDIKDNITGIKEDATSLRDDLQGQITTVTNTMTADYARKTDLTSTTETLRNETTESAAQFKRELSLDYAKKSDLQTTVEDLSNRIANDYSTKATVEQLADRISQTVSSLEVTSIDPEALNETIKKAQAAADEAEAEAKKAEAAVTTAKNAATAANNALASAKKTMEELQGNEDATYEQLTAAREQVDAAQTAANEANAAATAAEDYAVAARATANEAKKQVDIVSNLGDMKGRIKQAETNIEQNDQAIKLSATKTELYSSINGENLWPNQYLDDDKPLFNNSEKYTEETPPRGGNAYVLKARDHIGWDVSIPFYRGHSYRIVVDAKRIKGDLELHAGIYGSEPASLAGAWKYPSPTESVDISNDWKRLTYDNLSVDQNLTAWHVFFQIECGLSGQAAYGDCQWLISNVIVTDLSTLIESKSYTNSQLKITSESITSTVEKRVNTNVNYGRNLALKTGTEKSYTPSSSTYYSPVGYPINSDYGYKLLSNDEKFTVSYDWETTGVTTAFDLYVALQYTNVSYTAVSNTFPTVPTGDSSGHFSVTFSPTDAMKKYGYKWLFGSNTSGVKPTGTLTIKNFKFEIGEAETDWTPAPEDFGSEYSNTVEVKSLIKQTAEDIKLSVTEIANEGYIEAVGTCYDLSDQSKYIKVNNKAIQCGLSRGITITKLDRYTLEFKEEKLYDIYASDDARNNAATYLNSLSSDFIIIITSYDAMNSNDALNEAIWRCGGTKDLKDVSRLPYALIGIPGMGTGTGIENFTRAGDSTAPKASVVCRVVNGNLIGANSPGFATAAELKITKDSITQRVSDAEGDISTITQTPGQIITGFTTIQTNASTALSTANTAKGAADTAASGVTTLQTLIRQSGNGVEVARKSGNDYVGCRTLQGTDAFYIKSKDGTDLAKYAASEIDLGMNSINTVINLCKESAKLYCATVGSTTYFYQSANAISLLATTGIYLNPGTQYVSIGGAGLQIGNNVLQEFVVQHGYTTNTNDGVTWYWYYRKYSSKKITLWGYASHTANMKNGYGGNHFYESVSCTFPFTITARVPQVTVRCASGLLSASIHTETSTSLGMFIFENGTSAKTSGTVYVNVHVDGVYS